MQRPTSIERSQETSSAGSQPSSYTRRSLAAASLDMGRILADRGDVPFHVKGTCMYPTMRPGDVVKIQSRPVTDVLVGDIAVCQRGHAYFFCHRVIYKGEREGRPFIVTRTDRSRDGIDEPTFDENLLGVVAAIIRNGKSVPLQPTEYPFPARCYYLMRAALMQAAYRLRLRTMRVVARLVKTGLYRFIARTLVVFVRSRLRYIVNVPLNATLGDGVYRRFDPDSFDLRMEWKGKRIDRWTLMLHLNGACEPIARTTFVRSTDAMDVWHALEPHVRTTYCGAGLDDELLGKAKTILARSGQCLRPSKFSSSPFGTS